MERLRHRKLTEYASELDRELELLAAESYGARWNADRRRDHRTASPGTKTEFLASFPSAHGDPDPSKPGAEEEHRVGLGNG